MSYLESYFEETKMLPVFKNTIKRIAFENAYESSITFQLFLYANVPSPSSLIEIQSRVQFKNILFSEALLLKGVSTSCKHDFSVCYVNKKNIVTPLLKRNKCLSHSFFARIDVYDLYKKNRTESKLRSYRCYRIKSVNIIKTTQSYICFRCVISREVGTRSEQSG